VASRAPAEADDHGESERPAASLPAYDRVRDSRQETELPKPAGARGQPPAARRGRFILAGLLHRLPSDAGLAGPLDPNGKFSLREKPTMEELR
jgi:hypothetical protein